MKGYVTPILVWSMACAPLLCAICKLPRRFYLGGAGAFALTAVAAYIAAIGYGLRLTENLTASLDGHVYLHRPGVPLRRGDLVAFRWPGGASYPPGAIFIKRVVGLPGDRIERVGNAFWVAERYVGLAKPTSRAGIPLMPAPAGTIPAGEYFVATQNVDSLDSRYALAGNVKHVQILGRAYELF